MNLNCKTTFEKDFNAFSLFEIPIGLEIVYNILKHPCRSSEKLYKRKSMNSLRTCCQNVALFTNQYQLCWNVKVCTFIKDNAFQKSETKIEDLSIWPNNFQSKFFTNVNFKVIDFNFEKKLNRNQSYIERIAMTTNARMLPSIKVEKKKSFPISSQSNPTKVQMQNCVFGNKKSLLRLFFSCCFINHCWDYCHTN
jgi:hypothetical protein